MQKTHSEKNFDIHNWQHRIDLLNKQIDSEFSEFNIGIIKKYYREMVIQGIKKPTRFVHLSRLKNLTRLLEKDWKDATKEDMKNIIFQIMDRYSDDGQDTEYTYDHKKIIQKFSFKSFIPNLCVRRDNLFAKMTTPLFFAGSIPIKLENPAVTPS